ncbi:Bacterial regulatory helix-turn-helix protein, lysR family [Serratia fonticola]|uniref:Bacterial regulatory helix-turn-helix protein, lysR family n=1 Tax=Serratia fonticola TaxID=47917 RepID=A0A4U9V1S9_SERFO|nr:Bacterial regulatory helix-turn-helix protein, lysR family [Serratia fonticola]
MDRITAAEVFVTIVERGSMIAAADTLAMSRAMVTRYLAQMEQMGRRTIAASYYAQAQPDRCRENAPWSAAAKCWR